MNKTTRQQVQEAIEDLKNGGIQLNTGEEMSIHCLAEKVYQIGYTRGRAAIKKKLFKRKRF